jgi:hypothetical protein
MIGFDIDAYIYTCNREMRILLKHLTTISAKSNAVASPFKVGDFAYALA